MIHTRKRLIHAAHGTHGIRHEAQGGRENLPLFSCSPHESKKTNTMGTIYAIVYLKVYVVP